MTQVRKLWPLLTATHRYDKTIPTYQRSRGQVIEAPILCEVGCDHSKTDDPAAQLSSNHDLAFYRALPAFPMRCE